MAKSFDELPASMDGLNRTVRRGVTKIVQRVASVIGATVVDTTRVDTGFARSNWSATVFEPASGTITPYFPGTALGIGETQNANAVKAQQRRVIKRFNASKHRSLFITNNVDYIETLNNGNARLAPGLMVEQSFQAGKLAFKSVKVLA